ncbi:MAG: radical SAM protein [Candidatus Aenigmatarchaeota archaeon]
MNLDLTNPSEVKIGLLSRGVDCDPNTFANYGRDFYSNLYVYGNTSVSTLQHRFPQVLLLGNDVVSAFIRREGSPWYLRVEGNDSVRLYHDGKYVQDVSLPEKPAYYGRTLSDGSLSDSVIAVAGEQTPGFFLYPECYYFDEGSFCKFCSLKPTRRTVANELEADFENNRLAEATRLFQNTPWRDIPLVSITAGTAKGDAETQRGIIDKIRTIYDTLDPKIPIHALVHPPHDFALIDGYKDAGVTSIAFNIEVYNRDTFASLAPGKNMDYGYDKWMDAVRRARDVFGPYNAFCGLVWGLEPAENVKRAHREYLDQGIGITSNVFHGDPKTPMRRHLHPSEEFIVDLAEDQGKLYEAFPDARTIFSVSMRSTIDWEIHRGDYR